MSVVALSGNDTFILNGEIFSDLADGVWAKITFSSDIAQVKTGKNRNSIYAQNTTGFQADFEVRIVRGTANDQFMNNLLSQQNANFAGFPLMIGEYIKKIGDGKGNITNDSSILSGGIFSKQPEVQSSAEGDVNQSVVVYMLKFSSATRVLT